VTSTRIVDDVDADAVGCALRPDDPTASSSPPGYRAAWGLPSARPCSPTNAPTTGPVSTASWPPPNSPPTATPALRAARDTIRLAAERAADEAEIAQGETGP
jgi:hypothetical protein